MHYAEPREAEFIRGLPCCHCGAAPPSDAHHVLSKGAGEVTIPENLVPLCRNCHVARHYGGEPETAYLLEKASERTRSPADAILRCVYAIRRLDPADEEGLQAVLHSLPGRQGLADPRERQDRQVSDPTPEPGPVDRGDRDPPAESGWRRF